ncbi:plastid division protein PDV1 [Tanacetum coccineum]
MKWSEMEMETEVEVEAVLEKIWDLHDKLSDAIHSISRSHFVKALTCNNKKLSSSDDVKGGFVYVKDYPESESAIHEAKSLNSIRTALENLEDQLEFFHTVQTQQRAEKDAAIARLEQSRIVLALRLAEPPGRRQKPESYNGRKSSNILVKVVISSFNFAKKSLKVDHLGSVLGNAALFTVSMLALLQSSSRIHGSTLLEPVAHVTCMKCFWQGNSRLMIYGSTEVQMNVKQENPNLRPELRQLIVVGAVKEAVRSLAMSQGRMGCNNYRKLNVKTGEV